MLQLQEIKEYLSRLSLALRNNQIPVTLWIIIIVLKSISCLNWENQTFITAFWHKSLKRALLVLDSTIIYQFFASFQTSASKNQSLHRIQRRFFRHRMKRTNRNLLFAQWRDNFLFEGTNIEKAEHKHINANLDILGRNPISSIHVRSERNKAFYRKYRCRKATGTGISLQTTLSEQL